MIPGRVAVLLCLLVAAGCAVAPPNDGKSMGRSGESETREAVLDNGLKVLVKPDHRAPVVVSQVWYKVGSSYEPEGLTGISHLLEHMMFKGTERLGPNEFSRIIANNGGEENAFTGRDYTSYFQRLAKSKLPIAFELEADRMQNLKLDPDEFRKERQVVLEERRLRTEDQPESLTAEKFRSTAFKKSRYGNPVIGWPDDLASVTVEDLRDWYRRFYAPNNATIVVVGDVDPDEVFDLARKYFGDIPRQEVNPYPDPVEPPQKEARSVEVEASATVPYLLLGFHVPDLGAAGAKPWEPYALEVLAYLLDGGKTARLNRELVREQQVASSVDAGYDPIARLPSLFVVDANPASGSTVAELRRAILSAIDDIKNKPVTAEELDRVKAQLVASKVFDLDSIFYQGMRLGLFETNGHGWRASRTFNERLRRVDAAQVQAVAKKYLVESNMTEAVMHPNGMQETKQ